MSKIHTSIAAIPFINPVSGKGSTAGNRIYIEPDARKFFSGLNSYDKLVVARGIEALRSDKYPTDGGSHTFRPMFWRVKKDPGVVGEYLIRYEVGSNKLVVTGIELNPAESRWQNSSRSDTTGLYRISGRNKLSPSGNSSLTKENTRSLKKFWGRPSLLPLISLEFYRRILIHTGDYERAKRVKRQMQNTGANIGALSHTLP